MDDGLNEAAQTNETEESNPPIISALIPAHQPVNTDPPTNLEIEASKRLLKFLQKTCYETQERSEQRAVVLQELQEIANEFTRQTCIKLGLPTEIDGSPVQSQLFHFGSYRLGVCNQNSDIDVLCITPRYVNRTHFFSIFYDLLSSSPKVQDIQKIEGAFVPIITMTFDTVDIDLSFAHVDMDNVPGDIDLSDDTLLNNLDQQAVNSINGVRTNDMMLELVPNKQAFRILLRFIRLWSRSRAIYGNVYGYLGGVNCALLSAFIIERYPEAAPATLISMFFYELSEWKWPRPIYINTPNIGLLPSWDASTSNDLMPIITPAYPCINSLRSATKSTRMRMTEEFKRGFKITNSIIMKGKKWSLLIAPSNFFTKYKWYLQIKISADTKERFLAWEGVVESRIKKLSILLEENDKIEYAATYPKAFETPGADGKEFAGSFFIAMGFKKLPHGETVNIDEQTKNFLRDLNLVKEKHPQMLTVPVVIQRKDIPLFVFPDGKRPEVKKPKTKKK
ncbi:Poly(A) polymerase beta [Histomonas meleagridis]|uniref:Poly(A) polymerase beta n=1 Tax=Histomonas meleagridis TaxID=135588 RepID=UPI003559666A|nr:Poly(A) polymerase beta [Histomonas meleagridis]KAH0802014.1 Poly(A) polymerase beta [Histomonas meleagridis]